MAAESDLADLGEEILGPLRLGGVSSSLRALLPDALGALTGAHPRLVPTLVDGEAVDMVPLLARGDLDLLLIESWANRPMTLPAGLATRTLVLEEVHLAIGEEHPLAERDSVALGQLDGQVWASCPAGTEPYEALVQAVRAAGCEPEVRYTVTEFATQLALVARNLAVALLPEMGQRPAPEGVRFLPVLPQAWRPGRHPQQLRREVLAAWRASGSVPAPAASPAVRACVDALVQGSPRAGGRAEGGGSGS
jgi:DNA-binding transcriptional LysR family regulator